MMHSPLGYLEILTIISKFFLIVYVNFIHSATPISDTIPPVVNCPPNQQATVTPGQQFTVVTYPPATATDNSGGFVVLSYGNPSGTNFNIGNTVVVVTGTDPSGNVGQCTFTVTVTTGKRDILNVSFVIFFTTFYIKIITKIFTPPYWR